ncbi:TPA: Ig-like domain-containing protein, partial [Vibrio harveyi]
GDADVAINASGGNPGVSFKYQSLNSDVVTVINGKVHAVKPGSAQVRVTSPATDMHLEVSKEITITVEKAAGNAITVSDIAMTFGDADVAINASGGNPGVSFEYQALNPDIATVVDGKVHAVKAGTGRIRVISPATDTHKEVVTEFFVTVADAAFATSTVVRRELKSADYVVGKLVDITFKEDIDQDSVSISNDNAAILSVSSRVVRVKLLKAGTVVLYVRVNSINYHLLIYIGLR